MPAMSRYSMRRLKATNENASRLTACSTHQPGVMVSTHPFYMNALQGAKWEIRYKANGIMGELSLPDLARCL